MSLRGSRWPRGCAQTITGTGAACIVFVALLVQCFGDKQPGASGAPWEPRVDGSDPQDVAVTSRAWVTESGDCYVSGQCMYSPYWPNNYHNNARCQFTLAEEGTLDVQSFNTESGDDFLSVHGVRYSGSSGPSGVAALSGNSISFYSDGSVTGSGFKICLISTGRRRLSSATIVSMVYTSLKPHSSHTRANASPPART